MKNISDLLDNNLIYFIVIGILVLLIVLVVVSMLKDNKKKKVIPVDNKEKELAKLELEKVVKQMEENKDEEISTTYEEEQEDNAIISYQELLSKVKGNYEKKEVDFNSIKNNYINELDFDKTSDISKQMDYSNNNEEVDTLYNPMSKENTKINKNDDVILSREQKYVANDYDVRNLFEDKTVLKVEDNVPDVNIDLPKKDTKFKNSEFISPIHGLKEYDGEYFKQHDDIKPKKEVEVIDLDKELDFNEFSDKIKNTNDFLGTLKDLRSKL